MADPLTASHYVAARFVELAILLPDAGALSELRRLSALWPEEAKVLPRAYRAIVLWGNDPPPES